MFKMMYKEFADVFADFHADLYNSTRNDRQLHGETPTFAIPCFSMDELDAALRKIKSEKAKNNLKALVAEMLKKGDHPLKRALLELYNDALHPEATPERL